MTKFQSIIQLIELAATAPTVDALETMFDVVAAMFGGVEKAQLDQLIFDAITNHKDY